MSVPGSNLLRQAFKLIAQQQLTYYAYVSRVGQANGVYLRKYTIGTPFKGSFQPVPRSVYAFMGLDLQRNYANIFVPLNVIDISRDVSSDIFAFGNEVKPGPFWLATNSLSGGLTTEPSQGGQPLVTNQGSGTVPAMWQCISATRWYQVDGWVQVLCVEVPGLV